MSDQTDNSTTPFAKKTVAKVTRKRTKSDPADIIKGLSIVLLKPDGTESSQKFSIERVTGSAIMLKEVLPDPRTIIIDGVEVRVDLTDLKRRNPESVYLGKPVSLLVAAAELANHPSKQPTFQKPNRTPISQSTTQ